MSLQVSFRALMLCTLVLNPLWADDTEIFFSTGSNTKTQPNLLFVLDGSGSMGWYDCKNGDVLNEPCNDKTPAGDTSRLDRMVNALSDVLDETSGFNVGLMRFSHSGAGGRVIYPLSNIDRKFCNDEPCDEWTPFTGQSSGTSSSDDAYEDKDGVVVMDVPYIPTTIYDGDQLSKNVGLRFPDLRIPQGASIDDARIDFTSLTTTETPSNLTFRVEDVTDSKPFEAVNNNISDRTWWHNQLTWQSPEWTAEDTIETPNLNFLIQRIIDKSTWCGGNAIGISVNSDNADFMAASYDRRSNDGPVLRVTFRLDNIPADGGCTIASDIATVDSDEQDVNDRLTGVNAGKPVIGWGNLRVYDERSAAFSFAGVDVPKDAKIKEARISVTPRFSGTNKLRQTTEITLEDTAIPAVFENSLGNITNRPKTSAVLWTNDAPPKEQLIESEDISTLVQGLINKPDWFPGNSINAFMYRHSSSEPGSGRGYYTYEADPTKTAKLNISYFTQITEASQLISGPVTDVRAKIKEQLNDMVPKSATPTVGALYEAQRYFAGESVDYGRYRRCDLSLGSCYAQRDDRYSRVSHPDSYTGGNVVRHWKCIDNTLNSIECAYERIEGSPTYDSPIQHECQQNHIILVTDGEPTEDSDAAQKAAILAGTRTYRRNNCVASVESGGECGVELVKHMQEHDYSSDFDLTQSITTHAIGFNFSTSWLSDMAQAGGGGYYTADTAADLVTSVKSILSNVEAADSTFVAPGATIDSYSRISHREDIYLALFQPSLNAGWKGNLKKYKLKGNPPALYDANDNQAVNTQTGGFKADAQSYWSEEADGNESTLGGAASQLPLNRKLTTFFTNNDKALLTEGNLITNTNEQATNALRADSVEEEDLIHEWLNGIDVTDEDQDGDTTEYRKHIGDPLHSSPVVVTYGGTQADPDSVAYFGTNEGFVHAIDTRSGEELYAFMPRNLLINVKEFFRNSLIAGNDARIHGMDGDITLHTIDNNNNGIIEAADGDQAFLYIGMRRGGRYYYGLDVSEKNNPKYKWAFSGLGVKFTELGETWSKPVLTKIKVGNKIREVLIFAGGYDNSQDSKVVRQPDSMGRAIYIVDAQRPGAVYWAGSSNSDPLSATKEVFDEMIYSFPSDVTVVTEGAENLATQFYVGDMGGRIWRFDINNGSSQEDLVDGGIIADLGADGEPADARRFYHPPDLSITKSGSTKYINIAIGSGFHAHPLDTAISEKFFLITYPYKATGVYGIPDDPDLVAPEYSPITLDDLHDATANLIGQGVGQAQIDAQDDLNDKKGWFISMEDKGEKILGQSNTLNGVIRFTSYIPGLSNAGCGPNIGRSRFWAVNLTDATPDSESLAKGIENPTKENRNMGIPGGGIAPPVRALFVENETGVIPTVLSGANVLWQGDDSALTTRWFWAESPD